MKPTLAFLLLLALFGCALPGAEWKLALPGYHYSFPRDFFDHPEYRTEWWYFTGNLTAADGRAFGYELTFFRHGRRTRPEPSTGVWDTGEIFLAHLALSDIRTGKFRHSERLNRAGPGLAGVNRETGRIWNGNWSAELKGERDWALQAVDEDFRLSLKLHSEKAPVIHGENGVHQKASGAGKASHYVSLTRLATSGLLELNGEHFTVTGSSWMDHEFFTDSMSDSQIGWDWFSIQLSDNTELMLYRLRRRDGTIDSHSGGTYIAANGTPATLKLSDVTFQTVGVWKSPETGGTYPIAWRIAIPRLKLTLNARSRMEAQELTSKRKIGPSYWEGAMAFSGERDGHPITGVGYLELTGYADDAGLHGGEAASSRVGITR
ncbi:MAG: hypothetical protein LC114_19310 [Bryobacterales bacterium]|nr:hypothetical protein [Bryobacterales bacterium]